MTPPPAPSPTSAAHPTVLHQRELVIDLSSIDLRKRALTREQLLSWIPHRDQMALLDGIVWHAPDFTAAIGVKNVRNDEFWVTGHFPGRPLLPGVLQVEAAAQVAVYMFNARLSTPLTSAFTRIENCSFRGMVVPGDELLLLCQELKRSRRGFVCKVQGVVAGKLTFEADVHGLSI